LDPLVRKLIWISKIKEITKRWSSIFLIWIIIMVISKMIGALINHLFLEGGNNP
jgi:hypothetical protein